MAKKKEKQSDKAHPDERVDTAVTMLHHCEELHQRTYKRLVEFRKAVQTGSISNVDTVDLAYVLRELSKLHDDIRKETNRLLDMITNVTCLRVSQEGLEDESKATDKVRGRFATGSIDVKYGVNMPKRDTQEFMDLCVALGLPSSMVQHKAFMPHWPTLVSFVTAMMRDGTVNIPGIDPSKTYPIYKLTLRKNPKANL